MITTEREYNRMICETLKDILKYRGIGYKQIAPSVCGSTFTNKINLCGGKFTFFEIVKICNFLKIKVDDLLKMAESFYIENIEKE